MSLKNFETAAYALLWAFAIYIVASKLTAPPPEPPAKTAASSKLTIKDVMKGVRK